jgi:hypothetical protein
LSRFDAISLHEIELGITRELSDRPDKPIRSIGTRGDFVDIRLGSKFEALARRLKGKYGDLIVVSVGAKPFPYDPAFVPIHTLVPSVESDGGFIAEIDPQRLVIPAGDVVEGSLRIQKASRDNAHVSIDVGLGWLVEPDSLRVIGGYSGFKAPGGRIFHLGGAETEVNMKFRVGTDSFEPGRNYVVPSGNFEMAVELSIFVIRDDGDDDKRTLLASGGAVEVVSTRG